MRSSGIIPPSPSMRPTSNKPPSATARSAVPFVLPPASTPAPSSVVAAARSPPPSTRPSPAPKFDTPLQGEQTTRRTAEQRVPQIIAVTVYPDSSPPGKEERPPTGSLERAADSPPAHHPYRTHVQNDSPVLQPRPRVLVRGSSSGVAPATGTCEMSSSAVISTVAPNSLIAETTAFETSPHCARVAQLERIGYGSAQPQSSYGAATFRPLDQPSLRSEPYFEQVRQYYFPSTGSSTAPLSGGIARSLMPSSISPLPASNMYAGLPTSHHHAAQF